MSLYGLPNWGSISIARRHSSVASSNRALDAQGPAHEGVRLRGGVDLRWAAGIAPWRDPARRPSGHGRPTCKSSVARLRSSGSSMVPVSSTPRSTARSRAPAEATARSRCASSDVRTDPGGFLALRWPADHARACGRAGQQTWRSRVISTRPIVTRGRAEMAPGGAISSCATPELATWHEQRGAHLGHSAIGLLLTRHRRPPLLADILASLP
jgi:hypothetical protein